MNFLYGKYLGLMLIGLLFVSACTQKEVVEQENHSVSSIEDNTQNHIASETAHSSSQQQAVSKQPVRLSSSLQKIKLGVDKIKAETKFPLRLANDLSLDSVDFYISSKPIIRNEYTYLNISSSDLRNVEKAKARKMSIARQLLKNMCMSAQSGELKKEGVLLEYRYKTKDQKELIHFLLDLNKSCPKGK